MLNATPTSSAADAEKRVIGAVEEVILVPWEMKVRARVDTGAVTSSLDAREIQVRGKGRSRSVHFVLMGESGRGIAVELPLAGQRLVINSDGVRERRPFARVEVCVAGLRVPLEVTLNDRSRMEYRMLLGRNLLEGRFIVDVERALTAPPACPAAP